MRNLSLRTGLISALVLGLLVTVAAVLWSGEYLMPAKIFYVLVVPAGVATAIVHFQRYSLNSVILCSSLVYVVALFISTAIYGSFAQEKILSILIPLLSILLFISLLCMLHQLRADFAAIFCDCVVVIAAVSAAVNLAFFFQQDMHLGTIASHRLIAFIGVPHYEVSTSVSTTYAVYFVAAFCGVISAQRSTWRRILLALAAAVLLVGLLATQGRSGYIAALVGVIAVSGSLSRRNGLIAIGFAAACVLAALYPPFLDALLFRGSGYRGGIWLSFLHLAADRPIFGWGVVATINRWVEGHVFFHAHSLILSAEVRGGLLGLVSLVAMLGYCLYWSTAYMRLSRDPLIFGMVSGLALGRFLDSDRPRRRRRGQTSLSGANRPSRTAGSPRKPAGNGVLNPVIFSIPDYEGADAIRNRVVRAEARERLE
jgi:O-antigen ligase